MKKISGIIVGATVGAVVSVATFFFLNKQIEQPKLSTETATVNHIQPEVTFAKYAPITSESRVDFREAAQKSIHGVVHVTTEVLVKNRIDPLQEFFYGNRGRRDYSPAQASGSGVIISSDGFIVTNNHVIKGAQSIKVTLNNQKTYVAEVIGCDPNTDLALLKIDDQNLPFIAYGNSDQVEVGEWVLAVGNPFNLTSTVTAGIISAKGRDINILKSNTKGYSAVESFIQTDAAVNPGNSGGALVSSTGELVGINTAIQSNTGSYTGYSFAIPVNIVKKVVDDLLNYGTVQRGFIGVSIRNIDERLAKEIDIDSYDGVYVSGLVEDGAAKSAGIRKGDIITHIGDVEVNKVPELQEQVSKYSPGDQIEVQVLRENKLIDIPVTLKNKFGNTKLISKEETGALANLGAQFSKVDAKQLAALGIKSGLQVSKLQNGKLLRAGVREGFIITKIDRHPISNSEELVKRIENKDGGVLIEGVYPNGRQAFYGFGM